MIFSSDFLGNEKILKRTRYRFFVFLFYYNTFYVLRYCESLNVKKGGSINFDENSLTTKQCTGYVPHKPSWYDVEHLIPNVDERIAPSTYKVHG